MVINASYLCTGLHAQINITEGTNAPLLAYSLDLTYDANPFGFEQMNAFNTNLWTVNSSFSASELSFYSEVQNKEFRCPSDLGNCTLTFVDGGGLLRLSVGVEGVFTDILILDDVTYYKGTVFWDDGMVLRPDDACIVGWEWVSTIPNATMYLEYCCNRWTTLPDVTPPDNTCVEFTSNVEFYNDSITLANLQLIYNQFVGANMTIQGVNFTSSTGLSLEYIQSINYGAFQQCAGTLAAPHSFCFAQLYDPETVRDSEFAFFIDIYDNHRTLHWHSVAGGFEFRNGVILRNASYPFTPDQPCSFYQQGPIGIALKDADDGVSSKSSFCCSKWNNPIPSTTSSPVTVTPPNACSAYNLTLTVANNTNFAFGVLSTLVSSFTVSPGVFKFNPTSYSSFQGSGNFDIFYFYTVYDSYNCRGSTTNMKSCSFNQTDGQIYLLQLSTSFAPDSFDLFDIQASQGKLVQPRISPTIPCFSTVSQYNYPYPPMFVQATLCCKN